MLTTNINANVENNPITFEKCELKYSICLQNCDSNENTIEEECYQKCDIKLSECEDIAEANK